MSITVLNKYNFEGPYARTSDLKKASGVYIVYGNNDNGNSWTRIDVGESEDIRTRIESHDREPCWIGQGFKYIAYAPLHANANERMQIEKAVRAEKKLPCGDR